jgi:maltose alpha-D-glucosyltransferase/alpha-amylase
MAEYWWKSAKIYELYVDKFNKDLNGLTAQLPYFEALGINCLHILPHYPSPMIDDGYDISDYRNVREDLGTIHDMERLVREARGRGIRIILDLVLNHTSNKHHPNKTQSHH